jgi:hypothetical protein
MKRPIIDVTSSMIDPSRFWSSSGVSIAAMPPLEPLNPTAREDELLDCFESAPIIKVAASGSICLRTSVLSPVCAAARLATSRLTPLLPNRCPRMPLPSATAEESPRLVGLSMYCRVAPGRQRGHQTL